MIPSPRRRVGLLATALLLASGTLQAGVLPEERADAMYKVYDGGGLKIDGPSVLVRKNFADKVSVTANWYVDQVSGASIDVVVLGASEIRDERTQKSLSVDYLDGKTTYTVGAQNSRENDYDGDTAFVSLSHDMFGDLTTVTLGASRGWDTITKVGAPDFRDRLERRTYSVGVSQVLTRELVAGFDYEAITEQGYLQNPYRAIRYLSADRTAFVTAPEVYPRTRTSNAVAVRAKYYLPWRAAVTGRYRYFSDTWDVRAHTGELGYTHPFFGDAVMADLTYRYYRQTAASFYSDLFPAANFQNFMARDKELSTNRNQSVGVAVSYDLMRGGAWKFVKKSSVSLHYDYIRYRFDDFRDASVDGFAPGTEPLYRYDASVAQLFLSVWF
jgi:hypothetical protein